MATILEEAQNILYGDRQKEYGNVSQNFNNIAALWSIVLGVPVTPKQVALCMTQLKIAREMTKPKRDNVVDACAYLAALEKMETEALPEPPQSMFGRWNLENARPENA